MIEGVELLKGAEADLFAAFEKLLESGRCQDFYQRIDQKLDLIRTFPGIGGRFKRDHRRVLELKYSYGIYYLVYNKRIFVSAILPLKIDPETVRKRLT
jgi:hypothetical protein